MCSIPYQRGYSREGMSAFTTVFYLVADVGTWSAGLLTLWLCHRGMRLHTVRVLMFAASNGTATPGGTSDLLRWLLLEPTIAYAHGQPWDLRRERSCRWMGWE